MIGPISSAAPRTSLPLPATEARTDIAFAGMVSAAGLAVASATPAAAIAEGTPLPSATTVPAPARVAARPRVALADALAAFRKEASLTPAERARRDVLKSMNLTEDAIAAMPPAERKTVEEKISAEVARRLRLGRHDDRHAVASGDPALAAA